MKLSSPAFENGAIIPSVYTCEGKKISPPLQFENVPEKAKSLVLIMDDPDVPKNLREDQMFDHWVVFNIPPETKGFAENSTPPGAQGYNTAGKNAYYPPCPPDREHRYFFKLYALNCLLDLPQNSSKNEVEKAMEGHILEKHEIIGLYEKGKGY